MFDALHLIREAARAGELDLVFGLVLAVAAAALRLPEDGGGQGVFTRDLGDIVDDAVFVDEVLRLKVAGENFVFEAERDARVDDGLTAQRFDIVVGGNVDIGKHVEVGQPARARAGFAAASVGSILSSSPFLPTGSPRSKCREYLFPSRQTVTSI